MLSVARRVTKSLSKRHSILLVVCELRNSIRRMSCHDDDVNNIRKLWLKFKDGKLQANLVYTWPGPVGSDGKETPDKQRVFNLNRNGAESVSETLKRLQFNVWKHTIAGKKIKSKKNINSSSTVASSSAVRNEETMGVQQLMSSLDSASTSSGVDDVFELAAQHVSVVLYDASGREVDKTLRNSEAWSQHGTLRINNLTYTIEVNPPIISKLKLPDKLLSGFFLQPSLCSEDAELSECDFVWYRVEKGKADVLVSEGIRYIPTDEDIGRHLKLMVIPRNGDRCGEAVEAVSKSCVEQGPKLLSITERQTHTSRPSNSKRWVNVGLFSMLTLIDLKLCLVIACSFFFGIVLHPNDSLFFSDSTTASYSELDSWILRVRLLSLFTFKCFCIASE